MSVSHNLLAFSSGGSPQATSPTTSLGAGNSAHSEGSESFAQMLLKQQPDDVKALMQLLGGGQVDTEQTLTSPADIATDGNNLPAGMTEWLAQLDELRSETQDQAALVKDGHASPEQQGELGSLVDEWSQWLEQARQFTGELSAGAVSQGKDTVNVEAAEALATVASLLGSQLASQANAVAEGADTPAPALAGTLAGSELLGGVLGKKGSGEALADPARTLRSLESGAALQPSEDLGERGQRESRQEPAGTQLRATAERSVVADGQQPVQRNIESSPAAIEGKAAFAGKLAETIEALGGRSASPDRDPTEALLRAGTQTQAAAQGAVAARPVLAAAQTLNVPFGQAGWGDAVMDKMMWMSSQNLRSVEIRLDPADLGPLEIHIQTRGQEHQVQFVTQNPSVREALEAQMFRLREAFSQQGMDLANVSVGDSAVDQQTHHKEGDSSAQGGRGVVATSGAEMDEAGMMLATAAVSQAESSRLIDYYA